MDTVYLSLDIYVSTTTQKPSKAQFMWCSQHKGFNSISIGAEDPRFISGVYYIAIHGYEDAEYSLKVHLVEKNQPGHVLSSMKDTSVDTTDTVLCDNWYVNY